jgi:hypothetical protein
MLSVVTYVGGLLDFLISYIVGFLLGAAHHIFY